MNVSYHVGKTLGWTSATWITLLGGLLAIIGIPLFLTGHDWWAILVLTISFLTDWWDGCVARYHQAGRPEMTREQESRLSIWTQLNYKGVTHLGRSIDPFMDKVRFIGLLWTVGYRIIDDNVIVILTLIAVLLQLSRPIKSYLHLDHGGANRWGKMKVCSEVILMVVLVLGTRPLYGGSNPIAGLAVTHFVIEVTSLTTVILACASAWGHFESGYISWYTHHSSK